MVEEFRIIMGFIGAASILWLVYSVFTERRAGYDEGYRDGLEAAKPKPPPPERVVEATFDAFAKAKPQLAKR